MFDVPSNPTAVTVATESSNLSTLVEPAAPAWITPNMSATPSRETLNTPNREGNMTPFQPNLALPERESTGPALVERAETPSVAQEAAIASESPGDSAEQTPPPINARASTWPNRPDEKGVI